jgi:hypothetical protein
MYGSRLRLVIAATALTCPVFSATSAMTAGSTSSEKFSEKLGAVKSGSPIQSAEETPERLTRSWTVGSVAPPTTELIGPAVTSSSQESRKPKIRPSRIAMRAQKPRSSSEAMMTNVIVARATHWSCGQ